MNLKRLSYLLTQQNLLFIDSFFFKSHLDICVPSIIKMTNKSQKIVNIHRQ